MIFFFFFLNLISIPNRKLVTNKFKTESECKRLCYNQVIRLRETGIQCVMMIFIIIIININIFTEIKYQTT